jgi:hypothetical protein
MKKIFSTFLVICISLSFLQPFVSFAQVPGDVPLPVPPWQDPDVPDPDQSPVAGPNYSAGDWGGAPTGDQAADFGTKLSSCGTNTLKGQFGLFVHNVVCITEVYIIPIFLLIGFVIFLWSGSQFIRQAENEEARAQYKNALIWGIVIIFIMLSFWGIILLARKTIGI